MSARRRRLRRAIVGVALFAVLGACTAPLPPPDLSAERPLSYRSVYVVRRGWHADIVVDRSALLARGRIPEAAHFPDSALLEFGWGDRAYFMAAEPTAWLAARAVLTTTPSVLHVNPLQRPPAAPAVEVVRLDLSEDAFARLVGAISDTFDREANATAKPIGQGLAPGAWFYGARGDFSLQNTCNTWVARVLASAGLDIDPSDVVTAATLMRRVQAALSTSHLRE
jgi:uncharacterized protein (TIGR02117 family)